MDYEKFEAFVQYHYGSIEIDDDMLYLRAISEFLDVPFNPKCINLYNFLLDTMITNADI